MASISGNTAGYIFDYSGIGNWKSRFGRRHYFSNCRSYIGTSGKLAIVFYQFDACLCEFRVPIAHTKNYYEDADALYPIFDNGVIVAAGIVNPEKNSGRGNRNMKRCFARKEAAYFTAEAALVLSVTIWVIVLLVYIILMQYDRCVLELDMGALALKGCTVQAENKTDLLQKLELYKREIYADKYVAWDSDEISIVLSGDMVKVEQKGYLRFPFKGVGGDSLWEAAAVYENRRISPVSFLRTYRKLIGGK